MPHLDPIQSPAPQCFEPIQRALASRMGEHRHAARVVNHSNGVRDRESLLRHVGRSPCAEKTVERIALVLRPPACDEGACNVWSTDGTRTRLRHQLVHRHRYAQRVEQLQHRHGPPHTRLAQLLECGLQRLDRRRMQSQDMDFDVVLVRTELHARDHLDTRSRGRLSRRRHAADGVVVSQGDGGEPRHACLLDQTGWRCRTI